MQARTSNISLGDSRLHSHGTSYRSDFAAPLATGSTLRSPLQARAMPAVPYLHSDASSVTSRRPHVKVYLTQHCLDQQNKDLKLADLRHIYSSAYNRVGPCALFASLL